MLGYAPRSPPPRRCRGKRRRSAARPHLLGVRGARPRRHAGNTGPPRRWARPGPQGVEESDAEGQLTPRAPRVGAGVLGQVLHQPRVLESSGTRAQPSPPRAPNPTPQTMPCEHRALPKRPRNTEEAQNPRCPRVLTRQHRPPRGPDEATHVRGPSAGPREQDLPLGPVCRKYVLSPLWASLTPAAEGPPFPRDSAEAGGAARAARQARLRKVWTLAHMRYIWSSPFLTEG